MMESRSQSLPAPRQLVTFLRRRRADLSTSCWGPSQLPSPSWPMPSSWHEGSRVPRRLYWCRSRRTTEWRFDLVSADSWPLRTLASDLKHKSHAIQMLKLCGNVRHVVDSPPPTKRHSKADIDDQRQFWLPAYARHSRGFGSPTGWVRNYFARRSGCEVLWRVCLCVSVWLRGYL